MHMYAHILIFTRNVASCFESNVRLHLIGHHPQQLWFGNFLSLPSLLRPVYTCTYIQCSIMNIYSLLIILLQEEKQLLKLCREGTAAVSEFTALLDQGARLNIHDEVD